MSRLFPTTASWLGRRRREGETGIVEVRNHVMTTYAWPLEVYFAGSRYRGLASPSDVVYGFFADRFARADYLESWERSGRRLHEWLARGLCFYCQELIRKKQHDSRVGNLPSDLSSPEDGPLQRMQRALAVSMVRRAMENASERCRELGQDAHWEVFVRHCYDGLHYGALGITAERAAVMARIGKRRFREALEELIAADGVPSGRVRMAVEELLEACGG